jgi:twitching motility protein PilT
VAAYEILLGVPAVSNLIREAKTFQIATIMQTAKRVGMRLMNDALAELVRKGIVETEEALSKAVDKDGLRSLLKLGPTDGKVASEGL